jgi:hypothetical protein
MKDPNPAKQSEQPAQSNFDFRNFGRLIQANGGRFHATFTLVRSSIGTGLTGQK